MTIQFIPIEGVGLSSIKIDRKKKRIFAQMTGRDWKVQELFSQWGSVDIFNTNYFGFVMCLDSPDEIALEAAWALLEGHLNAAKEFDAQSRKNNKFGWDSR